MSNKTYVNLSHYDLDGVVCHIILKQLFPDIRHYCCGYGKFEKFVDRIIMEQEDTDILFVTDWTLTLDAFNRFKRYYGDDKFVYFDHHDSTLENLKGVTFKGKVDTSISASMIVFKQFEYKLKALPSYTQLKKLVEYTDAYDCWRISHSDFKWGYVLTELFYIYNWNMFVDVFRDGFRHLTKQEMTNIKTSVRNRWGKLEKEGKFIAGYPSDMIFFVMGDADGFINDITLLDKNTKYFFAYNPKEHKISVRLRNVNNDIAKVFDKMLKDDANIKSYGGHKSAGAFWFSDQGVDVDSYVDMLYKELSA